MAQPLMEQQGQISTPLNASFETKHTDLIHDVQIDYFGKLIATASSDHLIKIFEISNNKQTHIIDLKGHTGPIWRISWAHPKYGTMLASCGYDKKIIIWKYNSNNKQWIQSFIDGEYKSSVNCIQFAPADCGCIVAAGCSDGTITIYQLQNNQQWAKIETFKAHNGGVNSISWCPTASLIAIGNVNNNKSNENIMQQRFASGGCDNNVCIWSFDNNNKRYILEKTLMKHNDWICEVAWAPMPSSTSFSIIASGSEDKTVIIWKERNKKWNENQQLKFPNKVWSISWSELGNILAVASGDNQITLFKENSDGKWYDVTKINSSEKTK